MKKTFAIIATFLFLIVITLFVSGNEAIVKKYLWGSTTYLADSTNYVTLNKGFYVHDSLIVGKDLYVGKKGGVIYLDTTRQARIYFTGFDLYIDNQKNNGSVYSYIGNSNSKFFWYKTSGGTSLQIAQLDTINGFQVIDEDIIASGTTNQIKVPGDTASDYNSDDAITLNRQTGTLTTKSLTTGTNADYNLTFTNSLIGNNSRVFAQVNAYTGTGTPIVRKVTTAPGSATITIMNISGAAALNAAILLSVGLFNNP